MSTHLIRGLVCLANLPLHDRDEELFDFDLALICQIGFVVVSVLQRVPELGAIDRPVVGRQKLVDSICKCTQRQSEPIN